MSMTIVVAYLYNNNGMASWCIEACRALQSNDCNVYLVAKPGVEVPSDIKTIYYDLLPYDVSVKRSLANKIIDKIRQLIYANVNNSLEDLCVSLGKKNIEPNLFLLNQTNLLNTRVQIKQAVVAWAYRPFWWHYLFRSFKIKGYKALYPLNVINEFAAFRCDVIGYTNASFVMSVTNRLTEDLKWYSKFVYTVYPPISLMNSTDLGRVDSDTVVIIAQDLTDPRKNIKWLIDSLRDTDLALKVRYLLIGNYNVSFREYLIQSNLNFTLTGKLNRGDIYAALKNKKALLFGSTLDDWGFVQTEAIALGVPVIAPNKTPSDEIVHDKQFLYQQGDRNSLLNVMKILLNSDQDAIRETVNMHYMTKFHPSIFRNKVIEFARQ